MDLRKVNDLGLHPDSGFHQLCLRQSKNRLLWTLIQIKT